MLPCALPYAAAVARLTFAASASLAVPNQASVHLGITLRVANGEALSELLARQQDPASPDYRRWLTPAEFGQRFGQPAEVYDRTAAWLQSEGFAVRRYPNRTFLEASGSSSQVAQALSIRLTQVDGAPAGVHVLDRPPAIPAFLAGRLVHISGLDTRIRFTHRLLGTLGEPSFGPQDLRRFYDAQSLLDEGYVGQGQKLAVLSTALPPGAGINPAAIEYFLRNISDSSATFVQDVMPNPGGDFDSQPGGSAEFSLDVEAQSIGSPGAASITLVVSPASEVFTTGVNHIVNDLSDLTAVSASLGTCEPIVDNFEGSLATAFQQALQQGLAEGQTWSAASGDNGADDCQDGSTVAVDFPASIPEMVAMGGTELMAPSWDAHDALTAYQTETGWNDGASGGAGGGGFSILFAVPPYQKGLVTGTGRSVPDLALMSGLPGILIDEGLPGELLPIDGTSVASPLSAGFFGLIASRVGCRLGDVHGALYALGKAQMDGGTAVFHDILDGTATIDGVAGPSAGPGYDSVTGWGSLDVKALAEAWPACPTGPGTAGPAYDPCALLACGGGAVCETIPEGPASCVTQCADTSTCPQGTICSGFSPFSLDAGVCVPGCRQDSDCSDAGGACSTCEGLCMAAGNAASAIGDACNDSTDCPNGAECRLGRTFTGGYCTQPCNPASAQGMACGCPAGAVCGQAGFGPTIECLESCSNPGGPCSRSGYICQPTLGGNHACLPACHIVQRGGTSFDLCSEYGTDFSCELDSGICDVAPDAGPDAGPDGGTADAGVDAGADAGDGGALDSGLPGDAGTVPPPDGGGAPADGGTLNVRSAGCNCTQGAGRPDLVWWTLGLVLLRRRRKPART